MDDSEKLFQDEIIPGHKRRCAECGRLLVDLNPGPTCCACCDPTEGFIQSLCFPEKALGSSCSS